MRKKYTRQKGSNPPGKEPHYKTPEELQEKISEYFKEGVPTRGVIVGKLIRQIPVPTITGLVLFCGFADRQSFYAYEKIKKFNYTICRARSFIVRHYEELLQAGNINGAVFALKNFGWSDRIEIDQTVTEGHFKKYEEVTNDEIVRRFNALMDMKKECNRN